MNSNITLRNYQKTCLQNIKEHFKEKKIGIIHIPTGGGKTIIFNTFAIEENQQTLILVHREELLGQTIEKYEAIGGSIFETGIIKQGNIKQNKFTVAMIQTVYANLDKIDLSHYKIIIIDEAHHSMADTWKAVIEHIQKFDNKILGVTATPFRMDKLPLKEIYKDMIFKIDISDLIAEGYLCPLRGINVYINKLDFNKLKTKKNSLNEEDFTNKSITTLYNQDDVIQEIIDKWIELGENRKTIFFTSSIEHADNMTSEFIKKDISAVTVSSKLTKKDRKNIIHDFKTGKIKVINNVDILTEGFDDPTVECICLTRPTKSLGLYTQIIGRGLRNAPKKRDCLILDFTARNKNMTIVGLHKLFDKYINNPGDTIIVEPKETTEENGEKKRKLNVLINGKKEEFKVTVNNAGEYTTQISENTFILTCGKNNKILILTKENDKNKIYLNSKLLKDKLPDDYAWEIFTELWREHKDDWVEEYIMANQNLTPTIKQLEIINSYKEKLPEPKSKIDATNLVSYIYKNTPQDDTQRIIYSPDPNNFFNSYRYSYKKQKTNIAIALLLHIFAGIQAPKWISEMGKDIKTIEDLPKINTQNLKNKTDINIINLLKQKKIKSKNDVNIEITPDIITLIKQKFKIN